MSNHQDSQIPKRDNSKSNFELLSKMRLRIKEKTDLGKLKQIIMTNWNSRKRSTFLKKLKRNLNLLENGLYRNPFQEG